MTRQRLRVAHGPAELARIYVHPHDHRQFQDHHLRVDVTIQVARWMTAACGGIRSAADLSCGNGAILDGIDAATKYRGDFAAGYPITGPLEQTLDQIPKVDLYVCSETIEHLDDPDSALAAIRAKTGLLVLSTPVDAWTDDNPEHYWAWSRADVEEMLTTAGFKTIVYNELDFRPAGLPYAFGIWGCQ